MRDIDLEIPIERFDDERSTRDLAHSAVRSGDLGDHARMFVAAQTSGEARFGDTWIVPVGGVWCTLAWPIIRQPERVVEGLGLRAVNACADAVEHLLSTHGLAGNVQISWPNDVLVRGRRVLAVFCDVLSHLGKTYALVSIGINVNVKHDDFPEDIRERATSLEEVIGAPVHIDRFLDDLRLLLRDALMVEGLPLGTIHTLNQRLFERDKQTRVRRDDGAFAFGRLDGLDDHGRLILDTADGPMQLPFNLPRVEVNAV